MATNPDDTRRRHEAEAAAALLLLGRRRYDLPALIRSAKVSPRPMQRIAPTEALRSTMAAPYFDLVRAWAAERPAIDVAYAQARATGDSTIVQRQIEASAETVERALTVFIRRFPTAAAAVDRWHRVQWLARVKTATGLDVAILTLPSDTTVEAQNAVVWNQQLAEDVHQQAKYRIAAALLAGLAVKAPPAVVRARVNEALAKAKRRAAAIGVDQTDKLAEGMTRARAAAAGLTQWRWRHLDPQPHPRPEHQARDRRVYSVRNQPSDLPGMLPFCKCWTEPVLA